MRAALYVDCGSVNAEDIPIVCDEIRKTDELVLGKIYGEDMYGKGCGDAVCGLGVQSGGYGGAENETALVALSVDVMADTAAGNVQRVYIATGSSAFIPLLDKLRLTQVDVVVVGSCTADRELVESSQRYVYLEVIRGEKCTAPIPSVGEIAGHIYAVSSYYNGMGVNVSLGRYISGKKARLSGGLYF